MTRSLAIVEVARTRPGRDDYHAYVQILNGRLLTLARELGWEAQRYAAEDLGAARLLAETDGADAIVLAGGEDIAPERYGAVRGYPGEGPHAERADEAQIALGGTLVPDLGPDAAHVNAAAPAHERMHGHAVELAPASTLAGLFGAEVLAVQSAHHQAVDVLAPGLSIVARAEDGVVEAIEHLSAPIVGVQWHPEDPKAPAGQLAALLDGLAVARAVPQALAA